MSCDTKEIGLPRMGVITQGELGLARKPDRDAGTFSRLKRRAEEAEARARAA